MNAITPGRRAGPAAGRERAMFESDDIDRRCEGDSPGDDPGGADGGWRYPTYEVRVVLVAAVWVVPGVLFGLMAAVLLAGGGDPAPVAAAFGVLFGAAGAWQEAFW